MRRFDYHFIKNGIPSNIIGLSGVIADLKAKEEFRKLQYGDTFEKLRQIALVESVKGSNAIEGIVTTDDRIRDLVNGAEPVTHDELEISGYKNALNLIHTEHVNMDVNEDTLLHFHKMLIGEVNPAESCKYKSRDNLNMEYGADGRRKIRFKPVRAEETKDAIEQLLLAYYDARQDADIPRIILIPFV